MEILDQIAQKVEAGDASAVKLLVEQALNQNITAHDILNGGLLAGMEPVGVKFKNNDIFIPEVLVSARAMKTGLAVIKPALVTGGNVSKGKILIGTVKGDLHDIGKNIVAVMLEGAGFEVVDLGIDVPKEKFVAELEKNSDTKVVCMSALLTTTMIYMKEVIQEIRKLPQYKNIKIMIGGAPVTQSFANEIKADGYSSDAGSAVDLAKTFC